MVTTIFETKHWTVVTSLPHAGQSLSFTWGLIDQRKPSAQRRGLSGALQLHLHMLLLLLPQQLDIHLLPNAALVQALVQVRHRPAPTQSTITTCTLGTLFAAWRLHNKPLGAATEARTGQQPLVPTAKPAGAQAG